MKSLYDQLLSMTIVVADTGDIEAIEKFKPRDATTNPSLIDAAAQMPVYKKVVDDALRFARKELGGKADAKTVAKAAVDRLSVEFGLRILKIVPGRVSTEVDARLSYDTEATVQKAHALIKQYEAAGASRDRVLIKIASTWEGIRAAAQLEKEGIHCNLTLLFGLHQAIACAEAGVTLISPFVGRILDWYKKETGREYTAEEDPGVVSVAKIYEYYKHFGFKTEVMGASFRTLGEIRALAGCDLLTIAPKFLAELHQLHEALPRRLDPDGAKAAKVDRIEMSERVFRDMHAKDRMATEKLAEGITGFSKAIESLEAFLADRLAVLEGNDICTAAEKLFEAFDLDGDGIITREEWTGTDAVFDALDSDGDGKITPLELAHGIGATHCYIK
jgi:transaldolase